MDTQIDGGSKISTQLRGLGLADVNARYSHLVAHLQTVYPVEYDVDVKTGRAVNFAARIGKDSDQGQDNHGQRAYQNILGIFVHGPQRGSLYFGDKAS